MKNKNVITKTPKKTVSHRCQMKKKTSLSPNRKKYED